MMRLRAVPWAVWTAGRASWLYARGRISADDWHTRIGVARVAVGRDEVDVSKAEGKRGDG